MTTLTKEEVISQLQTALENQSGKPVLIEQAGSWYKIDAAKSVRFSELESMLAQFNSTRSQPVVAKKVINNTVTKSPMQAKAQKVLSSTMISATTVKGLSPKQLWREKLTKTTGKQTLPRGF